MILKWLFVGDTREETLHSHCSGLLEHRPLLVSRVVLRRHLDMAGYLMVTLGAETVEPLWRFPGTELLQLVGFYSESGIEMANNW